MTVEQQTAFEAFLDAFKQDIIDGVAAKLTEQPTPEAERLLNTQEAANVLGVHERTVRNLSAKLNGEAPRLASITVANGSRRFRMQDLRAYIESRRVPSRGEADES